MDDDRRRGDKLEVQPPNTERPDRETVRPQAKPSAARTPSAGRSERARGAGPTGSSRPTGQSGAGASDTNKPMILSILYLTSILVGVTGLVAFILALIWKSEPGEGWERSHYDYHVMTFLLWFGTTIVSFILIFTIIGALIGIPLLFVAVIWLLVRSIMALIRATNKEPMPNPGTWLA